MLLTLKLLFNFVDLFSVYFEHNDKSKKANFFSAFYNINALKCCFIMEIIQLSRDGGVGGNAEVFHLPLDESAFKIFEYILLLCQHMGSLRMFCWMNTLAYKTSKAKLLDIC